MVVHDEVRLWMSVLVLNRMILGLLSRRLGEERSASCGADRYFFSGVVSHVSPSLGSWGALAAAL